jgi:hypothetical protein
MGQGVPKTIYQFKPAFQRLLRPVSDALYGLGATPKGVRASAVALSLGTGTVLAWYAPRPVVLLLLRPVLFLRMALNAIDGMMAKEHGNTGLLGRFLRRTHCRASSGAGFFWNRYHVFSLRGDYRVTTSIPLFRTQYKLILPVMERR